MHLCPSWESRPSIRPHAGTRVNKQLSCTRWHGLCALWYAWVAPQSLFVVIVKYPPPLQTPPPTRETATSMFF